MRASLLLIALGVLGVGCSLAGDDDDADATGGASGVGGASIGLGGVNGAGGKGIGVSSGGASASGGSGATAGNTTIGKDDAKRIEDMACAGTKIEPESLPAVLQIVLDDSLSMDSTTPATAGRSKWSITRDALKETIVNLPGNIAIGLLYFPNMNTSAGNSPRNVAACVNVDAMVPIDVLGAADSAARQRLLASLDATDPVGSTPTHDAYTYGLNQSLLLTDAPGQRYMLLMTDGGPTLSLECMGEGVLTSPQPTNPIINSILAARRDQQIKTFLVGVPGTEDIGDRARSDGRPWMSTAAVVGGTAISGCNVLGPNFCHIDLTQAADFSAALRRGLNTITGSIVSCSYEVPEHGENGDPINLSQINVIYGPGDGSADQLVRRNDDPSCAEGWQLAGTTVSLCASTCDRIKSDPGARLQLLFGCETEIVIR